MSSWIKCSERLPDKSQDVLLLINENVFVGCLVIKDAYKTGRKHIVHHPEQKYFTTYEYNNCCNGHDPKFEDVTHWMPLPELPDPNHTEYGKCPCAECISQNY